MKTLTNQSLRDKSPSFLNALSYIFHAIVVNPTIKTLLVIQAFRTFFNDLGINWKKCFQVFAIAAFFAISAVVFFKLFIRALDIEAEAQEMVMIEYQESLKKTYSNEDQ